MSKQSKRIKAIRENVELLKEYTVKEALAILKDNSKVKFDESIDLAINLGVDPRKSDQMVRGASNLPNGSGKSVKIAVFAQGEKAEEAKKAGAEVVGFEDLAEHIIKEKGNVDFDVVVATPDSMVQVGKVGKLLGPKGLMPNPKSGTVTNDISITIANIKKGQAVYRTDKAGIIHCRIGAASFKVEELEENLNAVVADLRKLKPTSSKGTYIKKASLSSSMGVGLTLDKASLVV